jgi:choline dehydrogenase-like flavoprotein
MEADVIVIGAGGGGAVVAKELGEKGIKVLVLEAGPWYGNKQWPNPLSEHGANSSSSYDDLSIEILKQNFTDLEDDMNNYFYGKFRWGPANRAHGPWARTIAQRGYAWQNSGVGGSTLHYFANSPRAFPESVDNVWPISYQELVPYYEKVEATLPVSPAPTTPKEDLFYYGAKKAGWELLNSPDVITPGYRPQPNAILQPSFNYNTTNNAFNTNPNINTNQNTNNNLNGTVSGAQEIQPVGCTLRGHCVNGCHIGPTVEGVAKRSTLVSYIPRALSTGNVEIRPNAFVTKVLTETDGDNVLHTVGVIFRDTWTGELVEARAKVVVMAAGGIETPRLWLNSGLPENEWVGKGLVNHWFDSVTGIFDEQELINILGVPNVNPFVGQNAAARFDHPGLGVVETYGTSPGLYASLVYGTSYKGFSFLNSPMPEDPWDVEGMVVGEQLKLFMKEYPRSLSLLIFTDDDSEQTNSVTLDPVLKDDHGYIPKINYTPNATTETRRNALATIASEILRSAGAKTIIRSNWSPDVFIHITSTMRIGYVTDTNCEAHQVKRLYIADNSVLYNGIGGPNPTLTTQALATRTAEKIVGTYFS